MSYLDSWHNKREKKLRRNYEIDSSLYESLEELTLIYQATVADLINTAIEYLIKTENVLLYEKPKNEITTIHTINIRESNIAGMDKLKDKYGISIYKLVNIAIRNLLDDYHKWGIHWQFYLSVSLLLVSHRHYISFLILLIQVGQIRISLYFLRFSVSLQKTQLSFSLVTIILSSNIVKTNAMSDLIPIFSHISLGIVTLPCFCTNLLICNISIFLPFNLSFILSPSSRMTLSLKLYKNNI